MVLREQLLTAEQFFEIARLPENKERRLELEDGVIVEMAASRPINTVIASRVGHFLNSHILPNDLGYVTSPDGGFKLASGRVRQPDVAFVSKKRYPKLPSEFEGDQIWQLKLYPRMKMFSRRSMSILKPGHSLSGQFIRTAKMSMFLLLNINGRNSVLTIP